MGRVSPFPPGPFLGPRGGPGPRPLPAPPQKPRGRWGGCSPPFSPAQRGFFPPLGPEIPGVIDPPGRGPPAMALRAPPSEAPPHNGEGDAIRPAGGGYRGGGPPELRSPPWDQDLNPRGPPPNSPGGPISPRGPGYPREKPSARGKPGRRGYPARHQGPRGPPRCETGGQGLSFPRPPGGPGRGLCGDAPHGEPPFLTSHYEGG